MAATISALSIQLLSTAGSTVSGPITAIGDKGNLLRKIQSRIRMIFSAKIPMSWNYSITLTISSAYSSVSCTHGYP